MFLQCLLLLVYVSLTQILWAQDNFKVESASITTSSDSYYLNASLDYQLHQEAQEILDKGLPIRILFELVISQPRRYWFDKTLLEKEYEYVLQHDPITDRFDLTRLDTDLTLSYASSAEAIDSLHYLTNLLVAPSKQVAHDKSTEVSLRMNLDVRNFPSPLQYLSQYWGDWVQTSDWYTWSFYTDINKEYQAPVFDKELSDEQVEGNERKENQSEEVADD